MPSPFNVNNTPVPGTANIGESVQAIIDNNLIRETKIENNDWKIILKDFLEYGYHSLDINLLDNNKISIKNYKFPFVRKEFRKNLMKDDYVVIEPGDMLWKIAYKIYGDGWKYIEIFDSNKEQISNPDLIFPGQIFLLPKN